MLPDDRPSSGGHPIWFPAKRYGWGWGLPIAWQGWVVLGSWVLAMVIGAFELAGRNWVGFAVFEVIMCGLLIGVCYARGEKPRWRWGK